MCNKNDVLLVLGSHAKKRECVFSHFQDRGYTQYVTVDPQEVGYHFFVKYFNTPKKIKKLYDRGKELLQNTQIRTTYWRRRLKKQSKGKLYLDAFQKLIRQSLTSSTDNFYILPLCKKCWHKKISKNYEPEKRILQPKKPFEIID